VVEAFIFDFHRDILGKISNCFSWNVCAAKAISFAVAFEKRDSHDVPALKSSTRKPL